MCCISVCVRPLIPPAPCSHTGIRGSLVVLLPETEDGTPGLPQKSPPVRFLQPLAPTQGGRGVWASCCLKRKMARQGLPTNLLLQGRAPEGCAGCAGVPPPCAPEARAPRKGSVPGRDARAFPCAFAPSSPLPPAPTRGAGGVWASCCLKQKMACRGLPTNLPLQGRAPEGCAGCAGVPPACAPEARAPRRHAGAPQKPPHAKACT